MESPAVRALKRLVLTQHLKGLRPGPLAPLLADHRTLGSESREKLAAQALTLRTLLEKEGHVPGPQLLLELACLDPGRSRGRPGSIQRIWFEESDKPSRHLEEAADWWTRCMAAVGEACALTPDEHALVGSGLERLARLQLDPLDVLQALDAFVAAPPPDGRSVLLALRYAGLAPAEGQELARDVLILLERGTRELQRTAEDVFEMLGCLTPGALDGLHRELLAHGVTRPGFLFLGAGADAREQLLASLETTEAVQRGSADEALTALAWIGDSEVQRAFARWRDASPEWSRSLCAPLVSYAHRAAWELAADGTRRELHVRESHVLVPASSEAAVVESPVQVLTPLVGSPCGECGRSLVALLELDLTRQELGFLSLPGRLLRLAMCERCTYDGPTFTRVDGEGGVWWSPTEVQAGHAAVDEEVAPLPRRRLVLGGRRTLPFEAQVAWALRSAAPVSQLGGFPRWVQDADHTACPGCARGMSFVGQVQLSELGDAPEGTVYALLCADCGFAATTYQQT